MSAGSANSEDAQLLARGSGLEEKDIPLGDTLRVCLSRRRAELVDFGHGGCVGGGILCVFHGEIHPHELGL